MGQQLEFDYYISPDGETYSFHDAKGSRWLLSSAGQGMPDIAYQEQHGPYQHGVTVLDYRLQPRTITFVHERRACDRSKYWAMRSDIVNYLRPNRQTAGTFGPGKLRKILPDGTQRDIDAWIQSGPQFVARSTDQWREAAIREALRFYCPDPTFYDPTQVSVALTGSFCTGLIFPMTFPFTFCVDSQYETDTVTYTGTWLSYPIIYITGYLAHPVIANLTTGEILDLDHDVQAGQTVTIDCRYGYKTITDSAGNNLIGSLTPESDLATFHLAPDPEAPGGVNSISMIGYSPGAGASVRMLYYTRYIGI